MFEGNNLILIMIHNISFLVSIDVVWFEPNFHYKTVNCFGLNGWSIIAKVGKRKQKIHLFLPWTWHDSASWYIQVNLSDLFVCYLVWIPTILYLLSVVLKQKFKNFKKFEIWYFWIYWLALNLIGIHITEVEVIENSSIKKKKTCDLYLNIIFINLISTLIESLRYMVY